VDDDPRALALYGMPSVRQSRRREIEETTRVERREP